MKKLNIIVMSLLFFTNFSTAVPPNMTSFSLLVNNISIVARITNAIALQTELMKNRTDIGAIIRELIPGQYDFLPLIRKLNVKKANEFLRWLVQEFTTMRSYNGKMTEDELREALHLVKFLTENVENLNMLKEYNKGSAEAFYDTVMDLNVINPFKLCDKDTLELVSSLYRLNSFSDLDQTGNILDLFRNLSSDKTLANLQDCFGKVQNFHGSLEKQPLYRSFIELNKIRKLKDVDKFFQQKSSRFASIGKITENMEEFMEKMKGIWSKLPLVSNSTNIDRLMFLCSDIWDYVTSGRAPKRLTPGFIRPMDTIQVKEDLESSFFKNNIAKKKGVHRLTTALNYYLKFATESAKLEKAFADFVNFIKGEMPMIERMNQTLDTFFYFTAKNISARLKELTKDAHECSNKVVNPLGQNRFSQFEEAFNQPANILESLLMLKTVSKYGDDFFVPNMLLNMLNDFKMAEKKAEFDEETVVDWFKSYRERFDNHFTFDAVLFIHNFHDAVNSLDDNIKKFQKSKLTIQSFSVTDQIKSSSLFPVLECFKTKHFNFDLFRQTAIFLSNIVSFSENRMLVVTQSFFNQLNKIQEAQNNIYKVMEKEKKTADIPQSRVLLDFRNSLDLSQRFGKGVRVLREIDDIINQEKLLLDSANVSRSSLIFMRWEAFEIVENFFENPQMRHQKFQASLLALEKAANLSVNSNLSNTKSVFHAARKVIGFNITRKELTSVAEKLKSVHQFQDSIRLQELSRWNLDFASFRNILFGAGMAALPLNDQFDFFFGIRKEKSKLLVVKELSATSLSLSILSFFGVLFLIVCTCLIGYGFTKNGRIKYKNYWLQYFGKPEDFEKRWRYALFMDTVEGHNVVVDCAREVNSVNLEKVLKRGAYVNVYSPLGNTPLHNATKRGFPEIVQILITHGADRSLLNYQNKIAEQMLPEEKDYEKMDAKVGDRYRRTAQVYERLRTKKYRIRVPQEFPVSSFHIFMENRTNDDLTDTFMDKFQHITSDEALPTTTHCICHTTPDGVLDTNDFEVLQWIFRGVIIVKEQWMADCLQNPALIENDEKYLIHDVKYNDVLYKNSILPWTQAMAKGTMPYLQGVYMVVIMQECRYFMSLASVIPKLGGVLLPTMPPRETFNKDAHPYLHAHKSPVWILHDNTFDLSAYQNDADHLYLVISEQEFISLLLKREIDQNESKEPVSVVSVKDEFN